MPDEDGNLTEADYEAFIEQANKETLWWALYRMAQGLHSARYADPDCQKNEDKRGGLYNVVHFTADHWLPQIPGMPSYADVAKDIRADEAYHERTYLGERLGIYLTGDEFM